MDQGSIRGFSSSVATRPPESGLAEQQSTSSPMEKVKPNVAFVMPPHVHGGADGLLQPPPYRQLFRRPLKAEANENVRIEPILLNGKAFRRSRGDLILKRAFDLIIAGLLVFLSLPAMIAIAAAIKFTSPGQVFFRQTRQGIDGTSFDILKFRTMHSHLADASAERQTAVHDERVTRVGRFLRQTSLDELPQLLNVLGGSMSLVGPRPHALGTAAADGTRLDAADSRYASRHRVKPGITGWAQVNGSRGALTTVEQIVRRVDCDLYYIENWSASLDFKIICKTAWLILRDPTAH